MKVIEEKGPYTWKLECTGAGNGGQGCGSRLEAEESDFRYFEGVDYPVARASAVSFRCPVCSRLTDLSRDQWPVNVAKLKKFSTHWRETGVDRKGI